MKKKKALTLLELFFSLALLVSAAAVIVFKAKPMLDRYRFESSVSRLARELEWTHQISLGAKAEIDFFIEKKGETLFCTRVTDEPLPIGGKDSAFKVPYISHLFFDKENKTKIKISFHRSGTIVPEGKIRLSSFHQTYEIALKPSENRIIYSKRILDN